MQKTSITNWNKFPEIEAEIKHYTLGSENNPSFLKNDFSPRGNGRSYGDASLGEVVCSSLRHNKILFFDKAEGLFIAQSGILFSEILDVITPNGWFLPVTPGTKYITLGGAIAANVHGKNHHAEGSISRHIQFIDLLLANGEILRCDRSQNSAVFYASVGGMGLSGLIVAAGIQLKKIESTSISQLQLKAQNLTEILEFFHQYATYTYSVAWIDCLKKGKQFGRSILMLGEHSKQKEVRNTKELFVSHRKNSINIPFNFPGFVLNDYSIRWFNTFYYHKNLKSRKELQSHYDTFFYPLDSILNWNRIYGKRGFIQYQFVLPKENGKTYLEKILKRITDKGWGSFLAVLKMFGPEDEGYLSFPMEGYTLALDFPIRKGLFQFLDELDILVKKAGGRIYLTKDARMSSQMFKDTYPKLKEFQDVIREINPEMKFQSMLSKRLKIV
ncbi:FAD-binding oxidoreductase [uncultured Marivirga sp.]|uniref:FAD-binding oxidoreductase n=1 Tax=uncultured Marivirga sp. TaxID=1123707 RepID=UPI0030EE3F92|tara:strand:+ start:29989 stop:31317 length:1329 start_codon:yes stop_codon:yes gene_type:complete